MHDKPDILAHTIVSSTGEAMRTVLLTDLSQLQSSFVSFSEKLDSNVLDLRIGRISPEIPAAIDLHLHSKRVYGTGFVVEPVVVVDEDGALMKSSKDLASDMARTVFIAAQYPADGYERSMGEVYGEAFRKQAAFLDKRNYGEVENDPRYNEEAVLFKRLYPGSRYYFDPSFDMYLEALFLLEQRGEIDMDAASRLMKSEAFFVKARHLTQQYILADIDVSRFEETDRQRHQRTAAVQVALQGIKLYESGLLRL